MMMEPLDQIAPRLCPEYFGLGALWAWVYCTWFTPSVFASTDLADNAAVLGDFSWLISLLACALTLFALPWLLVRTRVPERTLMLIACVVVSAATLLLHISVLLDSRQVFDVIGAVLTGVASGFMWVLWGKRYGVRTDALGLVVPISTGVAAAAVIVTLAVPAVIALAIAVLLPLASGVLFVRGAAEVPCEVAPVPTQLDKTKALGVLVRLCAASLVACAISAFAQVLARPFVQLDMLPVGVVAGMVVVGVLSLLPLMARRSPNFVRPSRFLLLAEVVALALLATGAAPAQPIAYCIAVAVSTCFDFLLLLHFIAFVQKGFLSGAFALSFSEGAIQVGWLVGHGLGLAVVKGVQLSAQQESWLYLGFICVLFLLLIVFVDQQGNAEKITAPASDEEAMAAFAARYRLSKREAEICALLGQGRSIPFVSDALFLAKSTVETHAKHIYAKTGVHSRQELLTLIESEKSRAGRS